MMQNDNDLMWLNNCLSYKYYPIDESVNDSILDFIAGQLKYKSNILYLIIYTLEKYNILPTRFPGNQKPADYIIEEINKKRLTAGKNYLFGSFVKQYTENLKIFIEICRICKIRPVLMTQPMCIKNDGIIQFNHVIRDVCKKQKVPLIDLAEAFPSDNDKLFYDKVHFNNEGSKVAAEIIAKRFYEIIISDKIF